MPGQLPLQALIDLGAQPVQESNRDAAPLDNDIVIWLEHGRHLDTVAARPLRVLGVDPQPPLLVLLLEREHAKIDKQPAVSVLGQPR